MDNPFKATPKYLTNNQMLFEAISFRVEIRNTYCTSVFWSILITVNVRKICKNFMCEHALKNFILLGMENLRNSVVKAGELVGAFFPFVLFR